MPLSWTAGIKLHQLAPERGVDELEITATPHTPDVARDFRKAVRLHLTRDVDTQGIKDRRFELF
jgi:hypothetical protein